MKRFLVVLAIPLMAFLLISRAAWSDGSPLCFLPLTLEEMPTPSPVIIGSLFYDGYASGDTDEAFSLWNMGSVTVTLDGWNAGDGEGSISLDGVSIPPGSRVWIAREAVPFSATFGFPPDYEYGGDTLSAVPNLHSGRIPRFGNSGDELIVTGSDGRVADALAYGKGSLEESWTGPTLQPFSGGGTFGKANQVLVRKYRLDAPVPAGDTDSAADWVQDPDDPIRGRRPVYPGWNRERFWIPASSTASSPITLAVTPDNALPMVTEAISRAGKCICYEGYTLDSPSLALDLAAKASSGISVTLLLEGSPYGGIGNDEKWCLQSIEEAGGRVFFMVNDRNGAHARYRFLHSKMLLVDDGLLGIGTENLSPNSFPEEDMSNGTAGRRGVWALVANPEIVHRAREVWLADFDPSRQDIFRWQADDPKYGAPPEGYVPPPPFDWALYRVQFTSTLVTTAVDWSLVTAPEATLRPEGILGLVDRAGTGDEVLVEELEEPKSWSDGVPNPRLMAYVDAARRGAKVRLLLDSFFDHPGSSNSNAETVRWVEETAAKEGLDLEARVGNPTWQGLHDKMVLVRSGGRGWIAFGSLNGSETSSKANREIWLTAQSDAGYAYLARVFGYDWQHPNTNAGSTRGR